MVNGTFAVAAGAAFVFSAIVAPFAFGRLGLRVRVEEAEKQVEVLDDALRTILSIESGWCSPHVKRDWDLVRKVAAAACDSRSSGRNSPKGGEAAHGDSA